MHILGKRAGWNWLQSPGLWLLPSLLIHSSSSALNMLIASCLGPPHLLTFFWEALSPSLLALAHVSGPEESV